MKYKPKFKGEMKDQDGVPVFIPDDQVAYLAHKKTLVGEKVTEVVEKFRKYKQRSSEENRYYHGVVIKILSDELGYTPEEMHDVLKYRFLRQEIFGKKSRTIKIGSTATLSTIEMEDYLARIRMWAQDKLNITIQLPNEVPFDY